MSLVPRPDNPPSTGPRMTMSPTEDLPSALRRMAREQAEIMLRGFAAKHDRLAHESEAARDDDVLDTDVLDTDASDTDAIDDDVLDTDVHLARKAGKRLRALLRLSRSELGEEAYRRANSAVRDLGRVLADARTSRVLVDTLEAQVEASVITEELARLLRPRLQKRLAEARSRLRADTTAREEAGETLTRLIACIDATPGQFADGDVAALLPAIRRSYRVARKAMRVARDMDSADAFHEWRKRVNHLRFQMEAVSGCCGPAVGDLVIALDDLSELLGDDHDLAELWRSVEAGPDAAPEGLLEALLGESRLRRQRALEIAAEVLAPKPREFAGFLAAHRKPRL